MGEASWHTIRFKVGVLREEDPATLTLINQHALELPSLAVVVDVDGNETSVPLDLAPVTIGSDEDCDIVLDGRHVSRRHCLVALTEQGIVLRDLGSKNGTFLGLVRVREALLPPNTLVAIGNARLVVRSVGSPRVVDLARGARFGAVIGGSVPMRALFARLSKMAATNETILLRGESGTGKELLAQAIHDESPRRSGPFAVFDCGAVPPNLIEADLFGSVRGAFTGSEGRRGVLAAANGGTLFLDEIGELPLDLQPKLLRAVEARQFRPVGASAYQRFDARIVAATHRDLRAMVREGSFREDLFYRLAVVEARVPPLRERGEDLDLLVERFLAEQSSHVHALPASTMAMLRSYDFPGNVRELKNVLARLTLFPELGVDAFESLRGAAAASASASPTTTLFGLPLREAREQLVDGFEASYVEQKLRDFGGNVARAAQAAGVSRQFFYRLAARHGLRSSDTG